MRLTACALALATLAAGCRPAAPPRLPGLDEAAAARNGPGEGADAPQPQPVTPGEDAPVRVEEAAYTGFAGALPPAQVRQLEDRASAMAGRDLTRADMRRAAELALDRLREAGYPYARVAIEEARIAPHAIRLTLRGEPGPIAAFGRVDIVGNQRVDDPVIRRYVAYRPGERFSVSPIHETQRRLAALGLFEAVTIEVVDETGAPADVDTRIRVMERDPRAFDFSFGYGSEEQLNGEIEWRDLNFLGGARRLSLVSRWSWLDRGGQATFVEPYFFRPDLSLALRGQGWYVDERLYNVLSAGGDGTLSYTFARRNVAGVTYTHRYYRSRLTEAALAAVGGDEPDLRGATRQQGVLSSVRLDLVRDLRDAPLDPRRGYRASAGVEQAGGLLPGAFDFRATTVDGEHYVTARRVTFVHRASYGTVNPAGAGAAVPFFRRYFLGGAEHLRGWGRFEVGPLSDTGTPIGGRSYLSLTSEARIPLFRGIGVAGFLDAGNVWRNGWTLRPDDLRANVGVGLRYRSPFGPVRLDLGYQLTPIEGLRIDGEPQGRRWRIHFGAGF